MQAIKGFKHLKGHLKENMLQPDSNPFLFTFVNVRVNIHTPQGDKKKGSGRCLCLVVVFWIALRVIQGAACLLRRAPPTAQR
jgi:hypothetical protein